jgi:hypothetical protein
MDTKKYNCDSCNFHTNTTADWNRHLKSKKHLKHQEPVDDYETKYSELLLKFNSLEYNSSIKLTELETKTEDLLKQVQDTTDKITTHNDKERQLQEQLEDATRQLKKMEQEKLLSPEPKTIPLDTNKIKLLQTQIAEYDKLFEQQEALLLKYMNKDDEIGNLKEINKDLEHSNNELRIKLKEAYYKNDDAINKYADLF